MEIKELTPGQIVRHRLTKERLLILEVLDAKGENIVCRDQALHRIGVYPEELMPCEE